MHLSPFYQGGAMVKITPEESYHKQVLDWAHDQVRQSAEKNEKTEKENWGHAKSKMGFAAAVLLGTCTAGWSSVVGGCRTLQDKLFSKGGEQAEDAWERANAALQTVFEGLTGIVEPNSILTPKEQRTIAAINTYGQHLAQLNDISPEVRKTLDDQLKKAQVYVQVGDSETGAAEVTQLFKAFEKANSNPTDAAEKLKQMKWTKR